MRRLVLSLTIIPISMILLFGILTLTSCSSDPPEAVVAKYMTAVVKRDMDNAKRYCTDSYNSSFNSTIDKMLTYVPDAVTGKANDKNYKDMMESLQSEISGDTATVWVKNFEFQKFVLVKHGAGWKINELKFDYSGLTDRLKDLINQH